MKIIEKKDGEKLELVLSGRLETITAPQLQEVVDSGLGGVLHLQVDMEGLEYVSSAGLRVLLAAGKKMKAAGGTMLITGANENVREVFKITGFDTILNIQGTGK